MYAFGRRYRDCNLSRSVLGVELFFLAVCAAWNSFSRGGRSVNFYFSRRTQREPLFLAANAALTFISRGERSVEYFLAAYLAWNFFARGERGVELIVSRRARRELFFSRRAQREPLFLAAGAA